MKQDTSSHLPYPDWQPEYEAALLELDHNTLEERILAARRAISNRVQVLAQDHFGSPEERQAMADALNFLAMLERELNQHQRPQSAPSRCDAGGYFCVKPAM
jgi:hypothetical protein